MPNLARGGFRWRYNKSAPASASAPIMVYPVATAYATVLRKGDPVKLVATGTIEKATPGDAVIGVMDGAEQYWTGTELKKGISLPVSTWGTNLSRQSKVRVILARGQVFEVDVDENTTATTQAGYEVFVGENVEWVAGTPTDEYSSAAVDISGHAVTATLSVRIHDVPNKDMQDFAATGVKLHVEFNLTQDVRGGAALGT